MEPDFMEKENLNDPKSSDFRGARMIELPVDVFSEYVENSLIRRLYLTDVGFYTNENHYFMERKEGIEEYIFMYCTEGEGAIQVNEKQYILRANEAFCIPHFQRHCYHSSGNNPWSIFWVHFNGEDTQYFPLDDCKIIRFKSSCSSNQMKYLFDQLFRVLDGSYSLGNFIYLSQILSVILSEAYHREQENGMVEQNKHVTNIIKYMHQHIGENLSMK